MTARKTFGPAVAVLAGLMWAGSVAAEPKFTAGPAVKLDGDKVKISFTVSAPTDVEVAVLDKNGKVVRHLAAGLLGKNAPEPLEKDSLAEVVIWDGKSDYGEPAPTGRYEVTVRLGLGVKFGRIIEYEKPPLLPRGVTGFALDEKGSIFSLQGWMRDGTRLGHPELLVWDSSGNYQRTLIPLRRDVPPERAPSTTGPSDTRNGMFVSNGRVTFVSRPTSGRVNSRLIRILASDGSVPPEGYLGPVLSGQMSPWAPVYLAASPDGSVIYVSGLMRGNETTDIVFRASWTDKEAREFIPKAAGLKDSRGLATDSQGRLYVCDFDNDLVRVYSPEGKELTKLAVTGPEQVAVHPATGAVYVLSVRDAVKKKRPKSAAYIEKALVKYDGIETWKLQAEIPLPRRGRSNHDAGPLLALDRASSPPAILITCVGRTEPGDYLWNILDRGNAFERVEPPLPPAYWPYGLGEGRPAMAADRERDELYMAGRSFPGFLRLDGRTGQITKLRAVTEDIAFMMPRSFGRPLAQASGLTVDRKGNIYVRLSGESGSNYDWIRRYDRGGARVPFSKAKPPDRATHDDPRLPLIPPQGYEKPGFEGFNIGPEFVVVHPARGYHSGIVGVTHSGDMYIVEGLTDPKTGNRLPGNPNALNLYGPEGELKQAGVIPWLSAGAFGPRLDYAGNLYLTDAVQPRSPASTSLMKGGLVRFGPAGGRVNLGNDKAAYVVRRNEKDLPPAEFEGAHWVHYPAGCVLLDHCVCFASVFDLDGFGRSFIPDPFRKAIKVVDSAGNHMFWFGEYGNRDSRGPGSALPVPDIPIGEVELVAVSDRSVYIFDSRNLRVLQVHLAASAEEHVSVEIQSLGVNAPQPRRRGTP